MVAVNFMHGQKVRLTALHPGDLATIARWSENAEFMRLQGVRPAYPQTEASWAEWLAERHKAKDAFLLAIRPLHSDDLLGYVELEDILWPHGAAWLAIAIGEAGNWGQGYGTEALQLLLKFAFDELNLHRLQLTVFSYNQRAIAVYEKLGFQREGVYREFLQRDGQRYDMYLYGLLRREWAYQQK